MTQIPEKNDAPAYHTGATEFRMEPSLTFDDAPEWRERFEREFKHVHHPNIQAENIINDTKPLIVFIEAERIIAYNEGYEKGKQDR